MEAVLGKLEEYGAVLFGIGFMAPLIAQSLAAAGLAAPFGLPNIVFGLAVGITLGFVAKWRRRWL
jgi:hypothetical protein